jgi:hypothetical protein
MRMSRRALGLATLSGLTIGLAPRGVRAQAVPLTLPLSIGVAQLDGEAVATGAWIDAQVSEAQRLMAPHGLSVAAARHRPLPESVARLETGADRDALADLLEDEVINIFVVASLRDVDDPRIFRMGVRWRKRSDLRKDYVIIAKSGMPTTLCHELGHYFGNGHSPVVNNVMSYKRDDPSKVAFDRHQGRRMVTVARQLLAVGKLLRFDQLHSQMP